MKLLKKQGMNLCFAVIVAVLAAMPLLLQSGVLTASSTILYLGKCIAFAIVAMGLDLIWGYTGILSLGHGLYFALGGYAMAMYLKLQATGGSITDFMHVGGLTELPMIWKPFQTLPGAIVMLFIVPTVVSGLIGYFIFKNRVKGVYFSIISQALTWAAYSIFIALSPYTNGNVGITEIQTVLGSIRGEKNRGNMFLLFYGALLLMVLTYALCRFLTTRKFGKLHLFLRLSGQPLQDLRVCALCHHGGCGRRGVCQLQRLDHAVADDDFVLHHHGDLGRCRRTRHHHRCGHRRVSHQPVRVQPVLRRTG